MMQVKPKAKSLFEILADTLKRANEKYKVIIPWYIMVSKENKNQTIAFFEENNYFSYPKEQIKFFEQGEMPLLGSVDNVLLKMIEPVLLGLTIKQNNQIASKTIVKISPEERVGVFCKKNGKPSVIEYTELPKELAELRDENGELTYGESHIMCNLFSLSALEKIAKETLPYHIAIKKINYYKEGKLVEAKEPNCYKFEQFIFDSFPFFENITLLRGKREEDFAPVKNKEGNDSPETARKLYEEYWKI